MFSSFEMFWLQRSLRERRLLIALTLVVVMAGFYGLLWHPLHMAHDRALRGLERAQQQWQWLNDQLQAHPQLVRSSVDLATLSRRLGVTLEAADSGWRLQLRQVPAARAAQVLDGLVQAGVAFRTLQLDVDDQGRVTVTAEVSP